MSGHVFSLFVLRTGWNRISALSLFVENLLFGIEQVQETLTPLVLGHTRRLAQVGLCTMKFPVFFIIHLRWITKSKVVILCCCYVLIKILEKNSDLKSQEAFEEVITLLRSCKEGAVENIFR